jgi:hypothetical protein
MRPAATNRTFVRHMKLYFSTLASTSCRRESLGRRAILVNRARNDTYRDIVIRIAGGCDE